MNRHRSPLEGQCRRPDRIPAHHDSELVMLSAASDQAFLGEVARQAQYTRTRKRAAVTLSCKWAILCRSKI